MLGDKLDIYEHTATDLFQLANQLEEAKTWFSRTGQRNTDLICQQAIAFIYTIIILLERNPNAPEKKQQNTVALATLTI